MNIKELKALLNPELRNIQEKIENGKTKEVFEIAGDMEMLLDSISNIIDIKIDEASENPSNEWYDDFFVTYAMAYTYIINTIEVMKEQYTSPKYWLDDSGYDVYDSIIQNLKKYEGKNINVVVQFLKKYLKQKLKFELQESQLLYLTRAVSSWTIINAKNKNDDLFKYEMTENYYDCGDIDTVNIGECEIQNDYRTEKQDKIDGIPIKILQIIADKTDTSYNERVNSFYCFGNLHLNVNFSDKAKERIDKLIEKILKN